MHTTDRNAKIREEAKRDKSAKTDDVQDSHASHTRFHHLLLGNDEEQDSQRSLPNRSGMDRYQRERSNAQRIQE